MPHNTTPATPSAQESDSASMAQWIAQRARALWSEHREALWYQADRRSFWVLLGQIVVGVGIASLWGPSVWRVSLAAHHLPWTVALGGAVALVAIPMALTWFLPGRTVTRQAVAISLTLGSVLLVHVTDGGFGTRFHIFGSLAFLALYRDWKVMATATGVVVAGIAAGVLWSSLGLASVTGNPAFGALELGGWLVFAEFFLLMSIAISLREMRRRAVDQAQVEALSNIAVSDSRQEADTIMANVNQGLFLVGTNFRIGKNYSKAFEEIMASGSLQNQDFLQLLRRLVPEGVFGTMKDYLTLMFDIRKREKQLAKLNPLKEVEVTLPLTDGSLVSKHLEFRFNRIQREGRISHLLVSVSDATDRIRLEQKLQESEQGKEKQLDLLLGVLHVEPTVLQEFIKSTECALESANTVLKEESSATELGETQVLAPAYFRHKLEHVFREIHSIKGNAALLQLASIERRTHDIEDVITELQRQPSISGDHFLPIVLAQSALLTDLKEMAALIGRLVNMHRSFQTNHVAADNGTSPHRPSGSTRDYILQSASALVDSLKVKLGKEATFVCDQFEGALVPEKHRDLFTNILAQLVRNSITHGIENPDERLSVNKAPDGRIELLTLSTEPGDSFEFIFRDDGCGLDSTRLQSKAIQMGIASPNEIGQWPSTQLAALIFEPGFSTAADTSLNAGRGIGMDIIKTRVVDELGGEIRINSTPGQFCEFHIILPN